jgi:hypothetical protein
MATERGHETATAGVAGTPKRRRRSGGASHNVTEVLTLERVQQLHVLPEKKEVTFQAYILASDGEVQTRGQGGKGGSGREVAGFVAADETSVVQVSLWAEVAKKWGPKVNEWLDAVEDEQFPHVEVTACQVVHFRVPCAKELRRLQSTPRTTLKLLGAGPLVISPSKGMLADSAAELMAAPLVSCFQGVVTRGESLIHSRDDVPMKEIGVTMANGFEVPVMLYGIQTEEEVRTYDGVTVWFGEHRAGLARQEHSKGMVWLFSSGYLLNLGRAEPPPRGRQLNIGGCMTELAEEGDEE